MRLTNNEYQRLKASFHCTSWPDEENTVPIEVEGQGGGPPWVAYVRGDRVLALGDWMSQLRRPPELQALNGDPAPAPDAVPVHAPARKAA